MRSSPKTILPFFWLIYNQFENDGLLEIGESKLVKPQFFTISVSFIVVSEWNVFITSAERNKVLIKLLLNSSMSILEIFSIWRILFWALGDDNRAILPIVVDDVRSYQLFCSQGLSKSNVLEYLWYQFYWS